MNELKKVNIIVSVGAWNDQGKFLMVQEGEEDVKGLWNLPSGTLELNETLIEAAKREFLEETGYEVEITGLCGVFHYQLKNENGMSVRLCFHGKVISENTNNMLAKDIISCRWKTKEEIEKLIIDGKIRSKFAEKIIQQYFINQNYSLNILSEIS